MDKIIKELKELNKTMSSIRTFQIAETQLLKELTMELKKIGRDIKTNREVKNDKHWWSRFRRS